MVKRVLIIAILVLAGKQLFAQNQEKIIPVDISLWHPIALFPDSPQNKVFLNIGLPQTQQHNVRGLNLSLLGSKLKGCFSGLNLTGFISENQCKVNGVTIAGLGNFTSGEQTGLAVSCGINLNFNNVKGFELAAVSNFDIGHLKGFQFSFFNNFVAGHLHGMQLSPAMNVAASSVKGIQLSGMMNVTMENLDGVQIGFGNYARNFRGVQLGLINSVGRGFKGVQIGLINYSYDDAKVKLGLINVSRITHIQWLMYSGNSSYSNFAARFKDKYFFNQIGIGFPSYLSKNAFSGEVNYRAGVILPIKRFSLLGDLGFSHISLEDKDQSSATPKSLYSLQTHLTGEYQLMKKISVFVSGGYLMASKYGELKVFSKKPVLEFGVALF
ncbi:MAG: hypothetical protein Q8909_13900 [Bacteroidota bacterium]|nr:hypothetical protein [Bacteroidota bacterium]